MTEPAESETPVASSSTSVAFKVMLPDQRHDAWNAKKDGRVNQSSSVGNLGGQVWAVASDRPDRA